MEEKWDLPPLILHPIADQKETGRLLECTKANFAAFGAALEDDEARRYRDGRYQEYRMLCFIGRDVMRWVGQCMDFAGRTEGLADVGLRRQSFAAMLVNGAPESVHAKFRSWGVVDYRSILSRAIGLGSVFDFPIEDDKLSGEFLRDFHRYADCLYDCFLHVQPFPRISSDNYHFELYASGEYSRMLESQWNAGQS